ncbi:hypothetical protein D030_3344A, partial [Vibrio parahaemolyticus AQ3810]
MHIDATNFTVDM